jgi:hypothetical protein
MLSKRCSEKKIGTTKPAPTGNTGTKGIKISHKGNIPTGNRGTAKLKE